MICTLGIRDLSDTYCSRRRYLYIIARLKKLFKEDLEGDEFSFNVPAVLGKFLHLLIQIFLKKYFEYFEYFIFRNNLSYTQAAKRSLLELANFFKFNLKVRYEFSEINVSDLTVLISDFTDQINAISTKVNDFFFIIDEKREKVYSKIVDDEFNVEYQYLKGYLFSGKIDLVGYDPHTNGLFLIEVKTGKVSKEGLKISKRQVKLYKELFLMKKNINISEIKTYLWNTRPGPESESFNTIEEVEFRKYLNYIQKAIAKALRIKEHQEKLPKKLDINYAKGICDYCHYCKNKKKILPKRVTKPLDKFIFNNITKESRSSNNIELEVIKLEEYSNIFFLKEKKV